MKIPHVLSIENELPVRVTRSLLNPEKATKFNDGSFARTDYKYLYTLIIDKGEGRTFHQMATPSLRQLLWSIPVLWRAKDGDAYDRHDHPVVLQSFDVPKEEEPHGEGETGLPAAG